MVGKVQSFGIQIHITTCVCHRDQKQFDNCLHTKKYDKSILAESPSKSILTGSPRNSILIGSPRDISSGSRIFAKIITKFLYIIIWFGWKGPEFWDPNAYNNLCMPQTPKAF